MEVRAALKVLHSLSCRIISFSFSLQKIKTVVVTVVSIYEKDEQQVLLQGHGRAKPSMFVGNTDPQMGNKHVVLREQ